MKVDSKFRLSAMIGQYHRLLWDDDLYQDNLCRSVHFCCTNVFFLQLGARKGALSGKMILIWNIGFVNGLPQHESSLRGVTRNSLPFVRRSIIDSLSPWIVRIGQHYHHSTFSIRFPSVLVYYSGLAPDDEYGLLINVTIHSEFALCS